MFILAGAIFLTGCTGQTTPAQVLSEVPQAVQNPVPVTKAKGIYRRLDNRWFELTNDLEFTTLTMGKAVLLRGFVSDGSSSPFGNNEATIYAGFLHDALYHGSVFLRFPDGFPGPWSKDQADNEYCHQLKQLGVSRLKFKINCDGIKRFSENLPAWKSNEDKRLKYWRGQLINVGR